MSKVSLIAFMIVSYAAALAANLSVAEEQPGKKAEQLASRFLQAVKAKDLDGVMKVVATPWINPFDELVVKDADELRRIWQEKFRDFDPSLIPAEGIKAMPYIEFRLTETKVGDEDIDKQLRQIHAAIVRELDRVLDKSSWIVNTSQQKGFGPHFFILIRERAGNVEVVGGPYGYGYLMTQNRILPAARMALEKADQFELISLDPTLFDEMPKDGFHRWNILGKTMVKDDSTRTKLVRALKQSAEHSTGAQAGCFNPRHGLRVTRDGKTFDLVICFECLSAWVYAGKVTDTDTDHGFYITKSAETIFDEALRAAGVPLAEKSKK